MARKLLSIIIPTYNRAGLLSKALDSFANIEADFFEIEVIIVDDGSTDNTITMLEARKDPFELRWIRHVQSTGPAIARNHGAREAIGDILGFLDSDIIIDKNWWQSAKKHFGNENIAGVEGATIPFEQSTVPTPFTHIVSNRNGGNFLTCNMLYRKDVFLEIGGFDKRFVKANREDSDLGFSFLERGYKIVFEPACIVSHPIIEAEKSVYIKEAYYGLHEALLRRKHPALYRQKLKWIDGRAFPIFYWGVFFGLPLIILFAWQSQLWPGMLAGLGWASGWLGSVYAVCRKRKVSLFDILVLFPQYLIIPWIRLYWVLIGEWRYRKIKPYSA